MITVFDKTNHFEVNKLSVFDKTTHHYIDKVTANDGTSHKLVWEAWNGELLDRNNKFSDITGGWGATMQFSLIGATEATLNSNGIVFDRYGGWQKKNTKKKINIDKFGYLDIYIKGDNGIYVNDFYAGLYRNLSDAHTDGVSLAPTSIDRRSETDIKITVSLDGIYGEYYVSFAALAVLPYNFDIYKAQLR